jgi:RNA polymerase-binding protein DksA
MEQQQLDHFRKLIVEKRDELVKQLEKLKENGLNSSVSDSAGDHSTYSLHMADQGTDTMEREKQYMFAAREQNYLYHLEKALERIDKGEFGKCKGCGKEIGLDRLEAAPHVNLCIDCKSKEELTKSKY